MVKHLTHGGMAEVLLARSVGIEGFERHVVLKRIRAEQARDDQYVKMFLDEARLAASLHHQNIVQVHDVGEYEGSAFYAMEYLHSEDLGSLMQKAALDGPIPIAHVIAIVSAIASSQNDLSPISPRSRMACDPSASTSSAVASASASSSR